MGTPPPRASLRDGRRGRVIFPAMPSEASAVGGTTAGMSLRTRPPGGEGGAGAGTVSANEATGRPRRTSPVRHDCPRRTPVGAAGRPWGTSQRRKPRGRERWNSGFRRRGRGHATAAEVAAPVDVTARGQPWEATLRTRPRAGGGGGAGAAAANRPQFGRRGCRLRGRGRAGDRGACRCERGPRREGEQDPSL